MCKIDLRSGKIHYRGRLNRPLVAFQQAGRKGSGAAKPFVLIGFLFSSLVVAADTLLSSTLLQTNSWISTLIIP